MVDSNYVKNELWEVGGFSLFAILIIWGLGSIFFATIFRGLDDPNFVSAFNFYSGMIIFSSLAIIGFAFWNKAKGKREFIIPVHEPDESIFSKVFNISPKFLNNPLLSTIFFFLIFTIPVYWLVVKQYNLTFLPIKTQAIAPLGSVWANVVLPLAENMVILVLIVLMISVVRKWFYASSKPAYYLFVILLIPLLLAGVWVLFHSLVYSASGEAQISTFFAGFFWIMLVCLFMSMIPGFVFHFLINFFLVAFLLGWLATFWITVGIAIFYISLIVLFVIVYRLNKSSNKVLS